MDLDRSYNQAAEFIDYMGRHFPIQCGSDEFIFFPRARSCAGPELPVEDMSAERIAERLARAEQVKAELECFKPGAADCAPPTRHGPMAVTCQVADGFLREYGRRQVWRRDPCLYLEIFILGLLRYSESTREEFFPTEWVAALDRVLAQGADNLDPARTYGARLALDLIEGLHDLLHGLKSTLGYHFTTRLHRAMDNYRMAVKKLDMERMPEPDPGYLVEALDRSWGLSMSPELLCRIIDEEESLARTRVVEAAEALDGPGSWLDKYNRFTPQAPTGGRSPELYMIEAQRLIDHFAATGWAPAGMAGSIEVLPTPGHRRPVRTAASYAATPPFAPGQPGVFHIPPGADAEAIREHMLVTAHETVPGHHLLDTVRLGIEDPILSQVESALYYEGWATWAEELVFDSGYTADPGWRLVAARRQLWRTIRAQADLDLNLRGAGTAQAASRFQELGYGPEAARDLVRKYARQPGYQLCYTLGRRGFAGLRRRFADLDDDVFFKTALNSGQTPLAFIEAALARAGKGEPE